MHDCKSRLISSIYSTIEFLKDEIREKNDQISKLLQNNYRITNSSALNGNGKDGISTTHPPDIMNIELEANKRTNINNDTFNIKFRCKKNDIKSNFTRRTKFGSC